MIVRLFLKRVGVIIKIGKAYSELEQEFEPEKNKRRAIGSTGYLFI
jgi:hypothetical protein